MPTATQTRRAEILKRRLKQFVEKYGTSFRVQRTGKEHKGIISPLALGDFPNIQAVRLSNGMVVNLQELNPQQIVLDADLKTSTKDLQPGEEPDLMPGEPITIPPDGDDDNDRFTVEAINPIPFADMTIKQNGLIFADPNINA